MSGRVARELRKAADYDREVYRHIKRTYKRLGRKHHMIVGEKGVKHV